VAILEIANANWSIRLKKPLQQPLPHDSKLGTRNSELDTANQERLKLTIAYDGRPFSGWQSQPNRNGVQDHLVGAFARILEFPVKVFGAGRTDAGVHALGQVAHVDVPKARFQSRTWIAALNSYLPGQIRILKCVKVNPQFHARYGATGKVYRYRIWNESVLHPLEIGLTWHVPKPLAVETLRAASQCLVGQHDFASFAANRGKLAESTIRTIHAISIRRRQSLLSLDFRGDGFLYRMVRMLTGSLIQVALGREDLSWIEGLIAQPGVRKTNHTAPPEGLYLVRVLY
jgi:tRNA pseudouridine38-40 synthase